MERMKWLNFHGATVITEQFLIWVRRPTKIALLHGLVMRVKNIVIINFKT